MRRCLLPLITCVMAVVLVTSLHVRIVPRFNTMFRCSDDDGFGGGGGGGRRPSTREVVVKRAGSYPLELYNITF